jgi:ubiquinone biosynthesis protein
VRAKGSIGRAENARRLRLVFEELGGLWVKVGQLMALRIDLFSAELCRELSLLQDQANGFSFAIARRIVESDLGSPLSELFDRFEEAPFAAASIGQIHKARLKLEGVWVAVKVQRPYIAETVAHELGLIRRIIQLLQKFSTWSYMRWDDMYWELRHILEEEIDYRFEASNLKRMRKSLRRHNIYVPKVFSRYSSRRVLAMEFVGGALMADYIQVSESDPRKLRSWLTQNNIDPQLMARRLCFSLLRQVLEDNLYHGDLHPGNIILLRDSRVALIDFGTISFLEREYLDKFRIFLRSLATRDYSKATDLVFLLNAALPTRDLEPAKEDMIRALRAWAARTDVKELPYHEKSVDRAWTDTARIMFEHRCTADWSYLRLRRAFSTLDASLMRLYPDANYTRLIQDYFHKAEQRALRSRAGRRSWNRALMSLAAAADLPEKISELAFFSAAQIRRQAKVFQGTTTKFADLFAVLFGKLMLATVLFACFGALVLLERIAPTIAQSLMPGVVRRMVDSAPDFGSDTWWLFLALDLYLYWTFRKLRQRFRRKEVRFAEVSLPA